VLFPVEHRPAQQAFYSVRSERQLMEQLDYNLLFRWFVGLGMDAPIWDATVFTKNRERLQHSEKARTVSGYAKLAATKASEAVD
jgi:transposase